MSSGQNVSERVPDKIHESAEYLFYLHGAIVQMQGVNAVHPTFGPYQYLDILEAFKNLGFHVISERRPKETKTTEYAVDVSQQIQTLLAAGVPENHITVVGASMGAGITLDISIRVANPKIKYAVLGICREDSWKAYVSHYSAEKILPTGHFYSIFEKSDVFGSCTSTIGTISSVTSFEELQLNMGNGHGFLYKPYEEWLTPLAKWIREKPN